MNVLSKQLDATLLFTGVRNFARIVNILTLTEAHAFLADCTQVIIDAAVRYRGSLINISGDRLHFMFGDPATEFDNPRHAIKCALSIQNTADEISVKWRHALNFLVEIDVGISTGTILVGQVGTASRKQYIPIGNKVTLATQLAHLCQQYNVNVLLDSNTYDKTKDYFTFRKVADRLVLGFTERIDMYTPISGLT